VPAVTLVVGLVGGIGIGIGLQPPESTIEATAPETTSDEVEIEVDVVQVKDGDTIEVLHPGGRTDTIRYLGIDTPEKFEEYFGVEASRMNRSLVGEQRVRLVYDDLKRVGDLGRTLAYIYRGDRCINLELLRGGYATVFKGTSPQLALYEELRAAEDEAKRAGRGLWNRQASRAWDTSFEPETAYFCSKKTVHRPLCSYITERAERIDSLEEALTKRKPCKKCLPVRNHPDYESEEP
jgi:endonuclease YncB( thermonuclease family)